MHLTHVRNVSSIFNSLHARLFYMLIFFFQNSYFKKKNLSVTLSECQTICVQMLILIQFV